MTIPYRARKNLRRAGITILVLLCIAAALLTVWLLWLNRYIIYGQDGAHLDFELSAIAQNGEAATPPEPAPTVSIHYGDDKPSDLPAASTMAQLNGLYITQEQLRSDLAAVRAEVEKLPAGSTVMLDVKNVKGEFFYSSVMGRNAGGISAEEMDELLELLKSRDCYIIAKIPAFREYWFILDDESARVPFGLPRKGGSGALWLDKSGPNYWLNPASDGALNHLIKIVSELRTKGFSEVLFADFQFPETDQIKFDGNRQEALSKAAATLVKTCASQNFTVSFLATSEPITLPEGRCRLYFTGVEAADIDALIQKLSYTDPALKTVFLTDRTDTRYDAYGVLRPLYVPES